MHSYNQDRDCACMGFIPFLYIEHYVLIALISPTLQGIVIGLLLAINTVVRTISPMIIMYKYMWSLASAPYIYNSMRPDTVGDV